MNIQIVPAVSLNSYKIEDENGVVGYINFNQNTPHEAALSRLFGSAVDLLAAAKEVKADLEIKGLTDLPSYKNLSVAIFQGES